MSKCGRSNQAPPVIPFRRLFRLLHDIRLSSRHGLLRVNSHNTHFDSIDLRYIECRLCLLLADSRGQGHQP